VNDARAMAERLQRLGFVVIKRENMKAREIGPALREFRSRLSAGAVALFFYAGHGLQVKGVNYLPTIDAEIEAEEDVYTQALDVAKVLELMEEAKTRVNLVFLDACRNNPFSRRFRSASQGLAKVDAASGTLISFATRPGSVAADGEGRNGLYTEYLLKHMEEPGLPIEQVLKRAGAGVKLASKGRQEPWSEGLIEGEFYFRAATQAASPAQSLAAPAPTPATDPAVLELALWESVKDSRSTDELTAYLEKYPQGQFSSVARARLKTFGTTVATPPQPQLASVAPSGVVSPPSAKPGTSFRDCDVCPEMVTIPAGSFTMGSPESEPERSADEGPQHRVTIARAFAAGKYEVTFDEWDACVRENGCKQNPSDFGWGRGRRPVINVYWDDAKQYVAWLSRKTGKKYRLLTEAEWEYAARAGTTTAFSTGASINPTQANYDSEISYAGSPTATSSGRTAPVGSYPANAFGLHDVHGNASEWVEDCWNGSYAGAPSDGSAWASGNCTLRILRGGSRNGAPRLARSASRFDFGATFLAIFGSLGGGLRVARD
jgi:formylglycine-generating enzyme required for sulfatase activity